MHKNHHCLPQPNQVFNGSVDVLFLNRMVTRNEDRTRVCSVTEGKREQMQVAMVPPWNQGI